MRYWEPLDALPLDQMHDAACRLLAELGVRIHNPQAVEALAGAGAQVVARDVVHFPRYLVERAIAASPASFEVFDRRGRGVLSGRRRVGEEEHGHLEHLRRTASAG